MFSFLLLFSFFFFLPPPPYCLLSLLLFSSFLCLFFSLFPSPLSFSSFVVIRLALIMFLISIHSSIAPEQQGKAVVIIGNNLIEGSKQKLPKPLAVLKKNVKSKEEGGTDVDNANNAEYLVVGVVREKYIFKNRPKPLIPTPTLPSVKSENKGSTFKTENKK